MADLVPAVEDDRAAAAVAQLVRRADAAGMSLRAYVIEILHRHAALPTLEEWLDEVRADPPLPSEGPASVTLVEEGRQDSDRA